jgi:hypothetical protein
MNVLTIPRNANVGPVMNYSSTVLGYMNGQMYPNWVDIYVTNGTVWVNVPESILQATGCVAALTNST